MLFNLVVLVDINILFLTVKKKKKLYLQKINSQSKHCWKKPLENDSKTQNHLVYIVNTMIMRNKC